MNLHEAEILAKTLISEHNPGIHFGWSRAKNSFGDYSHSRKLIRLSRVLTPYCTHSEVHDTLIHEIAHSLCKPGDKHGPAWQRVMRRLGGNPSRTAHIEADLTNLPGNWYGVCPRGHRSTRVFSRKPRKARSCGKCSPVYNEAFSFTWYRV